ncbi:MAG: hypothetical protein JXA22_01090 [Candidatus Thermoplasmatota archaeon]|nr:hypothetical protein [Candidatus Thermoplasmatota archaeon]
MQNFEIVGKIKELRDRIGEIKEEIEILDLRYHNRNTEVESFREKRDALNQQVKELSQKPREILEGRKDVWGNISETNEEKKKIFREMQPFLQRIGELRKVRDDFNEASRGTLDRLKENYISTRENLLSSDISLKNELFMYQYLFELRDRLLVKREADTFHSRIVRIKEMDLAQYNEQLNQMEEQIGELKSRSHDGLETAKSLWARRDEIRENAQKEHKAFLDGMNQLRNLKKQIWEKRKKMQQLYRQIDEWRMEFKKSPDERKRADRGRKQTEAVAKYKRGEKLSLDELSLVMESGEMK